MTRNPRLGRRRARHLIDGGAAHAREQRIADLLDTLAGHRGADPRPVPPELLAAFAWQAEESVSRRGIGAGGRPRSGARSRGVHRALTVKTAAVVLVLSGGTMAVAAADDLPAPAQRAAHAILGSWGVPAPAGKPRPNKRQLRVNTHGSAPMTHPATAGPAVEPPPTRQTSDSPGARPSGDPAGSCATLGFGDGHAVGHDCASTAAATAPASAPIATKTATAVPTPTPSATSTATLVDRLVPSSSASPTGTHRHRGRPTSSPTADDDASQ